MQKDKSTIRQTKSVCPECLKVIDASIIQEDGAIYMIKECKLHGEFRLLLSLHPEYYKELNTFYFSLMNHSFPQRDYIVHLTNKCELNCPICLAQANQRIADDYPIENLKGFLYGKKGYKIDLMGAEPTERKDLADLIKMIKSSHNLAALHTNGIKLAEFNYLKRLKEAGLDEVHLQFDGFDDEAYEKIRGKRLLGIKLDALNNLGKLNISTDLVATIVRGVNEKEIIKIIDFGVKHKFVKEVFFLGCRYLGGAKNFSIDRCLMPDEIIDMVQEQTQGKVSRENVLRFQKLYFALLSSFSIRKCFYIQHFLITRTKDGYLPIDKVFDLEGIQKKLEKFKELKLANSKMATPYLFFFLVFELFAFKSFFWIKELSSFVKPFIKGFDLSKLPRKSILLGFISACDAYSLDYTIAQNCGKGAISLELGIQDTGAIDNVLRDKLLKDSC
jgi:uncharacterized radical SAM superfamily Fe-S cluster-containing enzyme